MHWLRCSWGKWADVSVARTGIYVIQERRCLICNRAQRKERWSHGVMS